MNERIAKLAGEITPRLVPIRHDLHHHPEIRFREFRTAGVIDAFLDDNGVSHERCTETGVVALIGPQKGRVVALRADIDALPMPDRSGLPYASVNENTCHACGHDGHTSMLLGAAWVLKQIEDELAGTVKLIWQPAEEQEGGASKMIRAGVLESPAPEAIFGLHDWPGIAVGKAAYSFGPSMASADNFEITVKGKGTHGALPHGGIDPITIAARIVEGLQLIRSRMINPVTPMVITVGTINGGSAVNVIPDEVSMTGTFRCLDAQTRAEIPRLMERMAVETARASGGDAVFRLDEGYPPVVNEERATAFARDAVRDILGPDNALEITSPVMGGEDFAYYLEKIPGSFLRLGIGDRPPLHNTAFDFNDDAIPFGVRVLAGLAVRYLETGL